MSGSGFILSQVISALCVCFTNAMEAPWSLFIKQEINALEMTLSTWIQSAMDLQPVILKNLCQRLKGTRQADVSVRRGAGQGWTLARHFPSEWNPRVDLKGLIDIFVRKHRILRTLCFFLHLLTVLCTPPKSETELSWKWDSENAKMKLTWLSEQNPMYTYVPLLLLWLLLMPLQLLNIGGGGGGTVSGCRCGCWDPAESVSSAAAAGW